MRRRVLAVILLCGTLAAVAFAGNGEDAEQTWWAYRALERPRVPVVADANWARNPIDSFILAGLEADRLQPAAPASKRDLIRRATYDLTGLPPSPEEVEAFVADDRPDAYEQLIERLLASPHYGERWGRHWLDLVRWAETDSYERDRPKPSAWRYRDWVINAFNADMPYDEFITMQLAGDEIEHPTLDSIIATGYYRLGIWDDEPTDTLQAQYDDLDSILDTTSRVMLGMSLSCARCHEHKRDPFPQSDYYRMLAFFRGIKPYKVGGGNATTPAHYVGMVPRHLGSNVYGEQLAAYEADREALLQDIATLGAGAASDDATRAAIAAEVDEGLVAHLALEETEGVHAHSRVGSVRTDIVDVTMGAEGRIGKAYRFDGGDDVMTMPRIVTDDFTISFWFKTTALASGPAGAIRWFQGDGLVDAEVPGIVHDFGVSMHSNGYVVCGSGKPEIDIHSGPGFNDGAWHHVAFTRGTDGMIALYVDGDHVGSRQGGVEPRDTPAKIAIGRLQPGHNAFNGWLDEIRFYDRVLDHREVMNLAIDGGLEEARIAAIPDADTRAAMHAAMDDLVAMRRPVEDRVEVLRVKGIPDPPQTFVLIRGNAHTHGDEVEPGFPEVLGVPDPVIPEPVDGDETSGRRLALAQWITQGDNPLTARVMMNRVWQHHFGRGLARTTNEFGRLGEAPTHPELLDWLAVEFVSRGWSLKAMHRLIMTSSTYRMSSEGDADALARDPRNDGFWRFDIRRLAAEEIRDSILAANGTINLQVGGPGVYPPMPKEILATSSRPGAAWGHSPPEQWTRRSVYIHVKRSLLTPLLTAFDLADTDASCPVRFATTQSTQALTMLNSAFMNDQAAKLAERLRREKPDDVAAQVARAIELVTTRPVSGEEVAQGVALIEELQREEDMSADEALKYFCLIALNLNEFVYLY